MGNVEKGRSVGGVDEVEPCGPFVGALPGAVSDVHLHERAGVLGEMNIGYGTGQCSNKVSHGWTLIDAAHPATLLDIPHAFGESARQALFRR